MCQIFGCTRDELPDREGWGDARMNVITVHIGTHVDAPLHYGSTCEGRPARTIGGLALDELYCDGPVLDLRDTRKPGVGISVEALNAALAGNGGTVTAGCALLLRPGAERYS